MPIYEYETVVPAGETPVRFEVEQRLHEAPLEHHPETGEPVRRLLSLPFLGGRWGSGLPGLPSPTAPSPPTGSPST